MLLTLMLGVFFVSSNAFADDAVFTVRSNAVLELTVPSIVNLNLHPTTNADFNTASMNISVGTNNPTGYTLTMTADSDTLTHIGSVIDSGSGNPYTPTILPILTTGSATGYTAAQFESSSTDAYTLNRWGYKLSTDTNFMPMTTTTTELSTTNAPSNGDTVTLDFAAKVDTTKPAGTYQTTLNFAAVTNVVTPACDGGKICYWPGPNNVTDTMGDQSVGSSATSAVLWTSNFKRPGYGFAGWTDSYDWVLGANDASGNGTGANAGYHIYGPNQTIEFTAGQYSTEGLSLYAVWVPSAGSIQNWTGCGNLTQGAVTALTDQRDNNTYAVAKLADGKCWMIENLRLNNTNSDNATGALAQGYGTSSTYGNFIGLANPETANFTNNTTANSIYYSDTQSGTASINIGTTNFPGYRMPRFRNDNTNTDSTANPNTTVANMTSVNRNIYSYGNYYSWPAAKANTSSFNSIVNSNAADTSICPKGWRLPKGGGNKTNESANDFWSLIVNGINNSVNPANYDSSTTPYYNGLEEVGPVSKKIRTFPNNFVYSGHVIDSSIAERGATAHYWSAAASGNNAWSFYLSSTYIRPGNGVSTTYYGFSVRCVLSPSN